MAADRPVLPDEKIIALTRAFEAAGIPYALGGATALLYWGEPRGTVDIDINIFLPVSEGSRTFDVVARLGVVFDHDAAGRELVEREQVRIDWDGTFVDLFFATDPLHESCRERAVRVEFLGNEVSVLTAEDLVVFKTVYDRRKDWPDIEQILAVQGSGFDLAYVRRWLERILGPDDSRIARLEALAKEYGDEP